MSISNKIYGSAKAVWRGGFLEGNGLVSATSSKAFSNVKLETPPAAKNYILKTNKFEENENITNPEELMCASLTSCLVMTLSSVLGKKNFQASHIETDAKLTMEITPSGFTVTNIHLIINSTIPNIDIEQYKELAKIAKNACPISKLLSNNVEITMDANLIK